MPLRKIENGIKIRSSARVERRKTKGQGGHELYVAGGGAPVIPFSNTKSMYFSAADEGLRNTDNICNYECNTDWSIVFWFKPALAGGAGNGHILMSKERVDSPYTGWDIRRSGYNGLNDRLQVFYAISYPGFVRYFEIQQYFAKDAWTHVAITYNGAGGSPVGFVCYINGTAATLSASGAALNIANGSAKTSALIRTDFGVAFNQIPQDNLDELTTWTKAVTALEVTSLYNGGSSNFDPSTLPSYAASCEHYYRCGDLTDDPATFVFDRKGSSDLTCLNMDATNVKTDVA